MLLSLVLALVLAEDLVLMDFTHVFDTGPSHCVLFILRRKWLHGCIITCQCLCAHGQESGRDEEMEQELTSAANSDPMATYDVDVTEEGQAIQEYMFLLNDSHA